MALTGLQIYKYLPKTNCKKCNFPTCLAFAMALSQGKISPDKCPDIKEESKEFLSSLLKPPVATIKWGDKNSPIISGGETVLFRHEKKFNNPPAFSILISDIMSNEKIDERIDFFKTKRFERMGNIFKIDSLTLKFEKDRKRSLQIFRRIKTFPFVLISRDYSVIKDIISETQNIIPVVITEPDIEILRILKEKNIPLGIEVEGVKDIEEKLKDIDYENIFLFPRLKTFKENTEIFSLIREKAIMEKNRFYSYPIIGYAGESIEYAASMVCKYASIIILDTEKYEDLFPLITLRLNIYTDPQKPLQVEPKLYEIGKTDKNSPVLITTNFSLTYFIVKSEIENSKVPSYLITTDSEGMSVLTAWSADKFNSEIILNSIKNTGIENRVKEKKLIIPGYVAMLKARIENDTDWQVIVGPKEASGIPRFLKSIL